MLLKDPLPQPRSPPTVFAAEPVIRFAERVGDAVQTAVEFQARVESVFGKERLK